MLTLNYLKSILFPKDQPDMEGVDDKDQVLEARSGLEGAVELLQSKELPVAVVLEHAEQHQLMLRNEGGFHECTQSVWIMEMKAFDEDGAEVSERCYQRFKRLYQIFIHRYTEGDAQLARWIERSEMNAYAREAGSYIGYEIFINFREYEDLSYAPRPTA